MKGMFILTCSYCKKRYYSKTHLDVGELNLCRACYAEEMKNLGNESVGEDREDASDD